MVQVQKMCVVKKCSGVLFNHVLPCSVAVAGLGGGVGSSIKTVISNVRYAEVDSNCYINRTSKN